jgi:hypothetical protein
MLGDGIASSSSSSSTSSSLFLLFVFVQCDTLGLLLPALRLPICNVPRRKSEVAACQGLIKT